MKLLHIDTSILGKGSVTRELTALIVERLADKGGVEITHRDLASESLPHFDLPTLPGAHPLAGMAPSFDAAARAASDRMLAEFIAADTVVVGAPMYNFTIPSQLKAWIDRVVVPGKTFRRGENGPEGLAGGKRVIVAVARGGFYGEGTAAVSAEHAESYLRSVFSFIGITDLEFIRAEGLSAGEADKSKAVASAREAVQQLAA